MALDISKTAFSNFEVATLTVQVYDLFDTDTNTNTLETLVDELHSHTDFSVSKTIVGDEYRRFDVTYNGTAMALINVAATITDNRRGTTYINFVGSGPIWMNLLSGGYDEVGSTASNAVVGASSLTIAHPLRFPKDGSFTIGATDYTYTRTARDSSTFNITPTLATAITGAANNEVEALDRRSQINLGLIEFGAVTGKVVINYTQNPTTSRIRPWDNYSGDDRLYCILGHSHGHVETPLSEQPIVEMNVYAGGADIQGSHWDNGGSTQTGQCTYALNLYSDFDVADIYPHSGTQVQLGPGTQLLLNDTGRTVEQRPISIAASGTVVGGTDNVWPDSWILPTGLPSGNVNNLIYPGVETTLGVLEPGGGNNTRTKLYVVKDYPFPKYGTIRAFGGVSRNEGRQNSMIFLDPETATPHDFTFERAEGNGNIFYMSSYTPEFGTADQSIDFTEGFAMRAWKGTRPTVSADATVSFGSSDYTGQDRNWVNYDLDRYGWEIDSSSGKNSYILPWGFRANRNAAGETPVDSIYYRGSGTGNDGKFDVYLGGPGRITTALEKIPYTYVSDTDETLERKLTEPVIQAEIAGYSTTLRNACGIDYGGPTTVSFQKLTTSFTEETASAESDVLSNGLPVGDAGAFWDDGDDTVAKVAYYNGNRFTYTVANASTNRLTGIVGVASSVVGATVRQYDFHGFVTSTAVATGDQLASGISSLAWFVHRDFSGLSNAAKNTNMYIFENLWEEMEKTDCNFINVDIAGTITLEQASSTEPISFTFGTDLVPTKGTTYTTLRSVNGTFDLGGNEVDCLSSGDNHMLIDGDCENLLEFALASPPSATEFSMRNNTMLNGTYTADGGNWIKFVDCEIATGGTFTINRANDAGTVFVIGAPSGTSHDSNVTLVHDLTITSPALEDFKFTTLNAQDSGDLFAYDFDGTQTHLTLDATQLWESGTAYVLNGSSVWSEFEYVRDSNTQITVTGGTFTPALTRDIPLNAVIHNGIGVFSIGDDSSLSSTPNVEIDSLSDRVAINSSSGDITIEISTGDSDVSGIASTGRYIAWSGYAGLDYFETGVDFSAAVTKAISRSNASVAAATTLPTGVEISALAFSVTARSNAGQLTAGIVGAHGSDNPDADETWFLLDSQVRGTADYNRIMVLNSDNRNFITNKNAGYSEVKGGVFRLTPGETQNQSVGYINETAGVAIPLANLSHTVSIAHDAPGVSSVAISSGIENADVATQTDVNNARNAIIGNL